MTSDRLQIRAQREVFFNDAISLRIAEVSNRDGVRTVFRAEPLKFAEITEEEFGLELDPSLQITTDTAQQFMDELWNCGIRPTEGTGSAGAMAATQKHLEDMRTLVFKEKD